MKDKKGMVFAVLATCAAFGGFAGTRFADWKERLPKPVYDADPRLVDFYFKAWEMAHDRIDEIPGIPAPRYMDEAHRSDRIWIWDTCFMVHFCKYCPREFPGIESLENFYGVMLADRNLPLPKVKGNRWCGADEGKMLDFRIHHPDNPPLFAWTEYLSALQTGDWARLEKVYRDKRWLQRWYELFENFDPSQPQPYGSVQPVAAKKTADGYRWGGCPSGMDNTPRGRAGAKDSGSPGACPNNPELLWVDALAQQALAALSISRIADLLGDAAGAAEWRGSKSRSSSRFIGTSRTASTMTSCSPIARSAGCRRLRPTGRSSPRRLRRRVARGLLTSCARRRGSAGPCRRNPSPARTQTSGRRAAIGAAESGCRRPT